MMLPAYYNYSLWETCEKFTFPRVTVTGGNTCTQKKQTAKEKSKRTDTLIQLCLSTFSGIAEIQPEKMMSFYLLYFNKKKIDTHAV
jgi:hypothetical protein